MPRTFGSLSAYEPGLMDKARWWLQDALTPVMGGDARRAGDFVQNKVMPTAEYLPGVGDAMAAGEAVDYFKQGQPIFGTLAAAGAMAGLVPGVGDAVQKGVKKGIRAYHGSPHDFDKFSLDKIGTGEGAQAYGHGLYFAESENVADAYSRSLGAHHRGAGQAPDLAKAALDAKGGNYDRAAKMVKAEIDNLPPNAEEAARKELEATLYLLENKTDRLGRMYEVNINADPNDFLDWDKPLSEQSDAVKEAYAKLVTPERLSAQYDENTIRAVWDDPSGNAIYRNAPVTDGDVYRTSIEERNAALKGAGIKGIKYLDAGSRSAGDGSRNYVVFDDALIEILRKYGLAGLGIGAGAGGFGSLAPQDENYQPPVL